MSGPVRSITSRDNPQLKRWRRLAAEPGAYRKFGDVWIEGDHLCSAFVGRGGMRWQAVVTERGWRAADVQALALRAESVTIVPAAAMAELSTLETPAPICGVIPWQGVGEIDPALPSVVLDRLQDPGNVGNVLRSAAAFGVGQVIALQGTVALWSPKVLRAAMGAHFGLRLIETARVDDLAVLRGPLLATSSHTSRAIGDAPLPWPCHWVLGHEGQGVDPALLERCAQVLRIPQPGGEESLNVAAAAAICFYEAARGR